MKHNNIEALLIDYLEGKLNPEQMKEAESILAGNKEYANMIGAWSQIKVEPDYSVMYKHKDALKRQNVIVMPIWSKWAVAATVALALSCALWVWNSNGIQNQENDLASVQKLDKTETSESIEHQNIKNTPSTSSSSMLNQLLGSNKSIIKQESRDIATQQASIVQTKQWKPIDTNSSESISLNENKVKSVVQSESPMSKLSTIQAKVDYQPTSEQLNFTMNQPQVKNRSKALATIENSLFTDAYTGLREEVKDKLKELQPSQIKNSLRNSSFFSEFRDALVPTSLEETLAMNK